MYIFPNFLPQINGYLIHAKIRLCTSGDSRLLLRRVDPHVGHDHLFAHTTRIPGIDLELEKMQNLESNIA